ncbi:MAG: hypothetical protein AVDCRST_MAG12-3516, partial [uncultured Rubrobacteraceae bacterium]
WPGSAPPRAGPPAPWRSCSAGSSPRRRSARSSAPGPRPWASTSRRTRPPSRCGTAWPRSSARAACGRRRSGSCRGRSCRGWRPRWAPARCASCGAAPRGRGDGVQRR